MDLLQIYNRVGGQIREDGNSVAEGNSFGNPFGRGMRTYPALYSCDPVKTSLLS